MFFGFIRNHIAKERIQRNGIIILCRIKWWKTEMPPKSNSRNIFLCARK